MLWSCFGTSTGSTESINEDIESSPVYANSKLGKIKEGVTFFIRGTTNKNAERFTIDFGLENTSKDIALRIAVAIQRNIIGRNSRLKDSWGTEETSTALPFTLDANSKFQLQILFTLDAIMIAIDGFHVAKFGHRLPFHDIRSLEIRGDVSDIAVERKIVTDYPQRTEKSKHFVRMADHHIATGVYDPADYPEYVYDTEDEERQEAALEAAASGVERPMPLPYYASFPKGFFDMGYSMAIYGRVRSKPHSFKASLQVGHNIWPQPTVALVLEFQFTLRSDGETGEPSITRNSFANGQWTGEVKSELATGLRPGADFHLVIIRGHKSFEIYLNEKPIFEYPYKVNPKYVDTLYVAGDILLFNIVIEEND